MGSFLEVGMKNPPDGYVRHIDLYITTRLGAGLFNHSFQSCQISRFNASYQARKRCHDGSVVAQKLSWSYFSFATKLKPK